MNHTRTSYLWHLQHYSAAPPVVVPFSVGIKGPQKAQERKNNGVLREESEGASECVLKEKSMIS